MTASEGELILVDNGSTDDTYLMMRKHASNSKYPVIVKKELREGLSRARNTGLNLSQGELILFTDDDCYLEPGYIIKVMDIFKSEKYDYGGGQVVIQDQNVAQVSFNLFERRKRLKPGKFIPAGSIQGSSMIFRRHVIDEIGLFDSMLGLGTPFPCEDIDYVARASFAGFTGGKFPELIVKHDHGRQNGDEHKIVLKNYDYGRGAYYLKYILKGKLYIIFYWFKESLGRDRSLCNEIAGAFRYLFMRARYRALSVKLIKKSSN